MNEMLNWNAKWTIKKYQTTDQYQQGLAYEIVDIDGNLLLNEGINLLWTLVCSTSGTKFDSGNSFIGVGDSLTPALATQTGLSAITNKLYKAVDVGFPVYGTSQIAIWQVTFGASEANFAWNEFTVANGNTDSAINLNRKVSSQGTKISGQVWVVSLQVLLS